MKDEVYTFGKNHGKSHTARVARQVAESVATAMFDILIRTLYRRDVENQAWVVRSERLSYYEVREMRKELIKKTIG